MDHGLRSMDCGAQETLRQNTSIPRRSAEPIYNFLFLLSGELVPDIMSCRPNLSGLSVSESVSVSSSTVPVGGPRDSHTRDRAVDNVGAEEAGGQGPGSGICQALAGAIIRGAVIKKLRVTCFH